MPGVSFEQSDLHPTLDEFCRKYRFKQIKFSIFLVTFQVGLLCLFMRFAAYTVHADASFKENGITVALGGGAGRQVNISDSEICLLTVLEICSLFF